MESYDVKPGGKGWKFQKHGSSRAERSFETKKETVDYAAKTLKERGGSVKIKKQNHRIQEERTYPRSKDPRKTKG